MRILGIDPGSAAAGYGVVERLGGRLCHVAHGALRPPRGAPLAARLAALQVGLAEVLATYAPDVAAVERVFVARGVHAALVLGQARGAALAALGAAGVPLWEYAAREVKLAVVGTGSAEKRQVQIMVQHLLGLAERPRPDAADALATAICHAHAWPLASLRGAPTPRRRRPRVAARAVLRRLR
jgi:crossover junction endodeoxyribonuclease RuvC